MNVCITAINKLMDENFICRLIKIAADGDYINYSYLLCFLSCLACIMSKYRLCYKIWIAATNLALSLSQKKIQNSEKKTSLWIYVS